MGAVAGAWPQRLVDGVVKQVVTHFSGAEIWGFPARHGGTPKYMVYFMENPSWKWMMTRGTPIFGNPHIVSL